MPIQAAMGAAQRARGWLSLLVRLVPAHQRRPANGVTACLVLLLRVIVLFSFWALIEAPSKGNDLAAVAAMGAAIGAIAVLPRPVDLPERIREGSVEGDLASRASPFSRELADEVASAVASLPKVCVAMLTIWIFIAQSGTNLVYPVTLAALAMMINGVILTVLSNLLVVLTAFWNSNITGILVAYAAISACLSGAIFPLQVIQGVFGQIIQFSPFALQVSIPARALAGNLPTSSTAGVLIAQAALIIVLLMGVILIKVAGSRHWQSKGPTL